MQFNQDRGDTTQPGLRVRGKEILLRAFDVELQQVDVILADFLEDIRNAQCHDSAWLVVIRLRHLEAPFLRLRIRDLKPRPGLPKRGLKSHDILVRCSILDQKLEVRALRFDRDDPRTRILQREENRRVTDIGPAIDDHSRRGFQIHLILQIDEYALEGRYIGGLLSHRQWHSVLRNAHLDFSRSKAKSALNAEPPP